VVDVLVISVREEKKGDFIIEFVKGLMSRGLVVCYAGACYCEKEDRYIYDNTTSLFFFSSTYFREAPMKSKDFDNVKEFLSYVDFKQVDARLVISVITCDTGICEEDGSQEQSRSVKKFLDKRKNDLNTAIKTELKSSERKSEKNIIKIRKKISEIKKISKVKKNDCREEISKRFECFKIHTEELEKILLRKIDLGRADLDSLLFPFYACKEPFRKRALYLYVEEERGRKEGANLFVYNEERISHHFAAREIDYLGKKFTPRREVKLVPEIIHFEKFRDLYSLESIRKIIDEYVLLGLHPPLAEIFFPDEFVLEVDPEEPDIGFLSKKMIQPEIVPGLENELWKFNWDGRSKIFRGLESENKKGENTPPIEGDTLIVGRISDLCEVYFAKSASNSTTGERATLCQKIAANWYQKTCSVCKYLPILAFWICIFLDTLTEKVEISILALIASIFLLYFVFWILQDFVLDYILQPFYGFLESVCCTILIFHFALVSEKAKISLAIVVLLFFCFFVYFSRRYISSAVFHDLNTSFELIDRGDEVEIEKNESQRSQNSSQDCLRTQIVMRCGRFFTILKKSESEDFEVKFNSDLFKEIECIYKNKCFERKSEKTHGFYASGIISSTEIGKTNSGTAKELIYEKPKTHGLLKHIKSLILEKGKVRLRDPLHKPSPSARWIYFGKKDEVTKQISSAIPIFPQSELTRNMIILASLSALLFNVLRDFSAAFSRSALGWLVDLLKNNTETGAMLIFAVAFLALTLFILAKLETETWKIILFLFFFLLIIVNSYFILVLFFIIIAFLMYFNRSFFHIICFLRILLNEWWSGDIVSIKEKTEGAKKEELIGINSFFARFETISNNQKIEKIMMNSRFWKGIKDERWIIERR
jgi:hypothetical protein